MTIDELNAAYETALTSINDILADIQCKIKDFEKQTEEKPSRRFKPEYADTFYYLCSDGDIYFQDYKGLSNTELLIQIKWIQTIWMKS